MHEQRPMEQDISDFERERDCPSKEFTPRIIDGDRVIHARYPGGPYITISFGRNNPSGDEVINVWDDETDRPEIPFSTKGVVDAVRNWMARMDEEYPEWYEDYLENARY